MLGLGKPRRVTIFVATTAAIISTAGGSVGRAADDAPIRTATSYVTPAACLPPTTIMHGGTYSGCWFSTTSMPAVHVSTTEPVTLLRSTLVGPGDLVLADPGADVRLMHVTAEGGSARFFVSDLIKSLTIRKCTIVRTGGIHIVGAQPSANISITRNAMRNVESPDGSPRQFVQFDKVTTATIDVSWNEVVNSFGQSAAEDVISLYQSAFAKVHDNYIGRLSWFASAGFSGSGVMVDGNGAHDNEIYANQIVETTNAGIGVSAGWNNKVHDNKLVFDGKLDDGTRSLPPISASTSGTRTPIQAGRTTRPTATPSVGSTRPGWTTRGGCRAALEHVRTHGLPPAS